MRLRLSNAYGQANLNITTVTIALPKADTTGKFAGSKTVLLDTVQSVTFGGYHSVEVPVGALIVSDPLVFPVQPAQVVTVSIFLHHGQSGGQITSHPGSRTQSWICHGDYTEAEDLNSPSTQSVFHWYFVSSIEAWQPRQNCAFAIIGDSLTDGRCSTDNGNDRWPDQLFDLMCRHRYARNISVLNQAAGGNCILRDGKGSSVMRRLDRDVLSQSGARYVMIFEGVNDIGTAEPDAASQSIIGNRLIQAYRQIVSRVHANGIPIFCATLTPFNTPNSTLQVYSTPTREQTRQRVNHWIRTSGTFDAVIDFDAVLRDPDHTSRLLPEYNSGDYLHPNVKAYRHLARSFPLDIFEQFADGVESFD